MKREPTADGNRPEPPTHLQKGFIIFVEGVLVTVNHHYTGRENLRKTYEDFIERQIENL